jgi:subtilisin family serine protease
MRPILTNACWVKWLLVRQTPAASSMNVRDSRPASTNKLLCAVLFAIAGCGGGDGTSPQVSVHDVNVVLEKGIVVVGNSTRASATLRDLDGRVLTARPTAWSSSANDVATVDNAGLVTGVAPGTARITASSEGVSGFATLTVHTAPELYIAPAGVPVVPNGYIVILDDTVSNPAAVAAAIGAQTQGTVGRVYDGVGKGFSLTAPTSSLALLRQRTDVQFIESDKLLSQMMPPVRATAATAAIQRAPLGWGLDRIDQRNRPLDSEYHFGPTGSGVTAYILDTGVRTTHQEFGNNRAVAPVAFVEGTDDSSCTGLHGTHVAGIVGGSTYGVAKDVRIVSVRIYTNCDGARLNQSDLLAAILWVSAGHYPTPAVANLSSKLTYDVPAPSIAWAMRRSISRGITWVVAAGNDDIDACRNPLAAIDQAIRVGAMDEQDTRSDWGFLKGSNWGPCVDIFAPGTGIVSASNASDTAPYVADGTSMAAPFVAGVVAQLLEDDPTATPATIKARIIAGSTKNLLNVGSGGSPNQLLYGRIGTQVPTIGLNALAAGFDAIEGGANPTDKVIVVENLGTGTLGGLSASVVYLGQQLGWLSATIQPNAAPASLTLRAATGTLPAGTHTATVEVSSSAQFVTNSPQKIAVIFTVAQAPLQGPAAPTGLQIIAVRATEVDLSWTDNSTNEDGFFIEVAPGLTDPFPSSGNVLVVGGGPSTATYRGLTPGSSYRFRVKAFNAAGNSAPSNVVSVTTAAAAISFGAERSTSSLQLARRLRETGPTIR